VHHPHLAGLEPEGDVLALPRHHLGLLPGAPGQLTRFDWPVLAFVLAITMWQLPIDLADVEPFDAYLIRTASIASIAIAVGGLVAAAFVPMAYCKYGCPTGMVLSFVRSHGKADVFGRRDVAAGLMVLLVVALYMGYGPVHHWIVR